MKGGVCEGRRRRGRRYCVKGGGGVMCEGRGRRYCERRGKRYV